MKYIAISGGWRKVSPEIEDEVRKTVAKIMEDGDGIVSGGALNVDSIALDEALRHDPKAVRIMIYLPTTLRKYNEHYRRHVKLRTITAKQAENLIKQLARLKKINPRALIENPDENFNDETKKKMYYDRNSKVVGASDELIGFHIVSGEGTGEGTADTIAKAREKGIAIKVFEYKI